MDRDVDLDERDVIVLLQQCEAEISKLLRQLEQQQDLKVSLEKRLVTMGSLKAPTTPIAPIAPTPLMAHMPEEILLLVFSELVIDDPLSIGPFLLVCCRWKNLICNSPLLWSRTPVCLVPHPPTVKRWVDYTAAALRYSGNTPLHLAINIPSFRDFWVFITLKLLDLPSHYQYPGIWVLNNDNIYSAGRNDSIDEISRWLITADDDSARPFLLLEQAESAISSGIKSISNTATNHISRLRSLTLRFHADDFTDKLYDSNISLFHTLGGTTTPMLEELTVIDDDRSMLDLTDGIFKHPIPSLIRVFWGVPWPVTTVLAPAPLGRLTHLRISLYRDLPPDEYTCSITHLFLDCTSVDLEYNQEGKSFYFPRLQDLALDGRVIPGFIRAPHLATLRLIEWFGCGQMLNDSPGFPSLTRLHVPTYVDGLKNLEVYVRQLPLLKEVGFLYFRKKELKRVKNRAKVNNVSRKAYLYMPDDDDWSFPAYENDVIDLDSLNERVKG